MNGELRIADMINFEVVCIQFKKLSKFCVFMVFGTKFWEKSRANLRRPHSQILPLEKSKERFEVQRRVLQINFYFQGSNAICCLFGKEYRNS